MSLPLFKDDVIFLQRLLRAEGLYKGAPSGAWDARTEQAAAAFESASRRIAAELGTFDMRSESAIFTLSLRAQREARLCMRRLTDNRIIARVISGTRTYAEQNALYRQGRYGNPGKLVTKARGGQSNHNFGIAWDLGVFTAKGGYLTDRQTYEDAAVFAKAEQIEWGGDWRTFVDRPHYQLKLNVTLAQVRSQFEDAKGAALFA
jgi:peptidoglycan L-alanyl-D-glutamate endopeptidase CwlK